MDGLWTAEFGSSVGMFGSGVVVFHEGKIMGGDNGYFYLGTYELNGNAGVSRECPFRVRRKEGHVGVILH
jgi:hypothetical protein